MSDMHPRDVEKYRLLRKKYTAKQIMCMQKDTHKRVEFELKNLQITDKWISDMLTRNTVDINIDLERRSRALCVLFYTLDDLIGGEKTINLE